MREDMIKKLMLFGLNTYEARAYMALVLRGTATASELSDISGVPYTRIYDVLATLENKGFIVTFPGKPIKYKAIHPRQALEGIKKLLIEDYQRKLRELNHATRELLEYLVPLYERSTAGLRESLVLIRGRLAAENVLFSTLERQLKEVYMAVTPNTFIRLLKRKPSLENCIKANKNTRYIILIHGEEAIPKLASENTLLKHVNIESKVNVFLLEEIIYIYEPIPDDLTSMSPYDVGFIIRNNSFSEYLKNTVFVSL